MGLRINNNIAALNSYNNVNRTDKAVSSSLQKLSSGFRINKAADDAAGLVVSEGLRSQIGGLTVASRNAQDGVNVAQTVDGSLSTVTSILQRMRDLAVQAANGGSQDSTARDAANTEFDQLSQEIDRISQTTKFGSQSLLTGYTGTFQVGANNSGADQITINLTGTVPFLAPGNTAVASTTYASAATTKVAGFATAPAAAGQTMTFAENGVTTSVVLGAAPADTAALRDQLNGSSAFNNLYTASLDGTDLVVTAKSAGAGTVAIGGPAYSSLYLTPTVTATPGANASIATPNGFSASALGIVAGVDLKQVPNAQKSIDVLDNALKSVSTARARVGAYQNRFEQAINNISISIENITASESAIRDTDMAAEMTKFTKNQILSQAGTSMLAQANSSTQNILTLLRG
jgi:flagellin